MAKASTVKISVFRAAVVTISGNWSQKMSVSKKAARSRSQSARTTSHASSASVAA
jgi:hypothetical protein